MKFVGRTFESGYLDRLYDEPQGTLCVVYGRRRIGKTRLLTHWLETKEHPGFYWLATDSSASALLTSLSQMIDAQSKDRPLAEPAAHYLNWDELFLALAELVQSYIAQPNLPKEQSKYVVMLDEFSYAIEAYPDLPHKVQAAWDHYLKELPILLILSGSHIGMMEDGLLAHRSPLYARATGLLKLEQLPFKDVRTMFPHYDVASCVALYSVLGGVPYYLEQLKPELTVVENILQRVMGSPALVQDEPRLLLHDHFAQPRLYATIIAQVATGTHSPKEIGQVVDLKPTAVIEHLETLIRLGILKREVPATERHAERNHHPRYRVIDPYLRFYHRFLLPQLPFLVRGAYKAVWNTIERHWRAFVGTHTFEELCREWVYVAAELGQLPFLPQVVGSHWSQTEQIDVVAINWDDSSVLYGECKWKRDSALSLREVEKLVERSKQIDLKSRSGHLFTTHYIFFSRSGFTKPAQERAKELDATLVDLTEFDAVLAHAVR